MDIHKQEYYAIADQFEIILKTILIKTQTERFAEFDFQFGNDDSQSKPGITNQQQLYVRSTKQNISSDISVIQETVEQFDMSLFEAKFSKRDGIINLNKINDSFENKQMNDCLVFSVQELKTLRDSSNLISVQMAITEFLEQEIDDNSFVLFSSTQQYPQAFQIIQSVINDYIKYTSQPAKLKNTEQYKLQKPVENHISEQLNSINKNNQKTKEIEIVSSYNSEAPLTENTNKIQVQKPTKSSSKIQQVSEQKNQDSQIINAQTKTYQLKEFTIDESIHIIIANCQKNNFLKISNKLKNESRLSEENFQDDPEEIIYFKQKNQLAKVLTESEENLNKSVCFYCIFQNPIRFADLHKHFDNENLQLSSSLSNVKTIGTLVVFKQVSQKKIIPLLYARYK